MITPQKAIQYERYEFKKWESHDAETIVETPVSLTVNGEVWLTFMCTPVNLEAMAVGFLYNEGIIESMNEVEDVRVLREGEGAAVLARLEGRHHLDEVLAGVEDRLHFVELILRRGEAQVVVLLHRGVGVGQVEGVRVPHDDALHREHVVHPRGVCLPGQRFL